MKRNFLTAVAVMVTAIFAGTTIAQAADISFSGQVKPRWEHGGQNDYNDKTSNNDAITTRIRLNATAKIDANTSAFISLQSVGLWGGAGAGGGTRNATGGGGAEANDQLNDVGVHQGFFTLKNFADTAVNMQVGRQEIVLDGHRLLGNTLWTQGAQSHDAIVLSHAHDNATYVYGFSKGTEGGRLGGIVMSGSGLSTNVNSSAGDTNDINSHVFWANYKGINGGDLSLYHVILDNESTPNGGTMMTTGFRHKGKMYGLDYRAEYYYQYGQGGAYAQASDFQAAYGAVERQDYDAFLAAIRVGKTFKNVMWSPTVTLWYDYLSGTDDDDIADNDWGTFHTLFDTGHKFYGLMDNYLAAGGGNSGNLGLQDLAVKFKLKPREKWLIKADYHQFFTATNAGGNVAINRRVANLSSASDNDWGSELDMSLHHKYSASTSIVFGYSHYWTTDTFRATQTRAAVNGSDDADWAYLQMDVHF